MKIGKTRACVSAFHFKFLLLLFYDNTYFSLSFFHRGPCYLPMPGASLQSIFLYLHFKKKVFQSHQHIQKPKASGKLSLLMVLFLRNKIPQLKASVFS